MKVIKQTEDQKLILKPMGRIDTTTAPELSAEISLENVAEVYFDLSSVDYISSAGLRVFLATHQKMAAKGGKMVLAGVQPMVRDIFDIAGFLDVFTIKD